MSEPRKRTNAEVWQALEKITAEAELERVGALSDDELDRELLAAGIDPSEAAKVGQADLARPPKPERKAPRTMRWVAWAAVAAAAALVVGGLARKPPIVGSARLGDPGLDPDVATRRQQADAMREAAFGACDQGLWVSCEEKLNAARALDPEGEREPKVLAARQSVFAAEHADGGPKPEKPTMP
jgi:hypothetical protein